LLLGILVLGGVFQAGAPCGCFLTSSNLLTTAQEFSYIGIAALGAAMVIMTAGIDLSIGGTMCLSGLITSAVIQDGHGIPLAILAGLGVGLGVGAVNGLLVTVVGMQPFIATLGIYYVAWGYAEAFRGGLTVYPSSAYDSIGQGTILGVPNPVWVMIVLAIALTVFLRYARLGRHIYAVGGNQSAARLLGIRVKGVQFFAYVMSGLLGAVAGLLLASFLGEAAANVGSQDTLNIIAAAVIGGVSLFGGEGSLIGVVLGAALVQEIDSGLIFIRVNGIWDTFVLGIVILLAIGVDQLRRRLRRA
ncbi:MAG TPA: ABC transporter permease, partial [Acidimicrobiales bacterium]|nr:ABC transporter permease [Acidimicrobiales bacterium]